jgi:hypothetical protein
MPSVSEIFAYLSKLVRSWWLLVPIVVGTVRLVEWLFRHGRPFPIPPRVRWAIAIGGVIAAQFLTYEDVENERRKLSSEKASLEGQLRTKKEENETLSSANKELSKRLQDAPQSNLPRPKGSQQPRTRVPQDAVITEIARLADRGTEIQSAWLKSDDTAMLIREYTRWTDEVMNTLNSGAGSSYTVQFKNAHGSAFMGCPSNHSVDGCGYWQEISGKNTMLMNAVTELRQRR